MFKRFCRDTSGNIAIITALTTGVLLTGVGIAVDYGSMTREHNRLQAAVDTAILAAAANADAKDGEIKKIVKNVVSENYDGKVTKKGKDSKVKLVVDVDDDTISVQASTTYVPALMGMFGYKKMPIQVTSGAPRGQIPPINIALVVDTTDSMAGSNMADLQLAARELIDALDDSDSDVHMSLVPYGQYVNIGMSRAGADWLDTSMTFRSKAPGTYEKNHYSGGTSPTCTGTGVMIPTYTVVDGVQTQTGEYEQQNCTGGTPGTLTHTTTETYAGQDWTLEFNGCVGSRANPQDTVPAADSSSRIPAAMDPVQHRWVDYGTTGGAWSDMDAGHKDRIRCGQEITPLTSDLDRIEDAIDTLVAEGETYLPSGLLWGWRTLTPEAPLRQAAKRPADAFDVMIFMTDGQNSTIKDGEYHRKAGMNYDGARAGLATSATICEGAKLDGIEIYTVAYNVANAGLGSETTDMLAACASSGSHAFTPDTRSQLVEDFRNISRSLSEVRLTF